MSANDANRTSGDTAAIRALLDRLADAWARGDGAAYGAAFAADATYVTYLGTLYQGPDDIGSAHQALFEGPLEGTRLATHILDIRFYGVDTAVVTTRGDTHKGTSRPGSLRKVQTYTMVRGDDGHWLVAAFQNTKHRRLLEAVTFRFQPNSKPLAAR
jgi:uncharacterized protein (TIGR02246 family)